MYVHSSARWRPVVQIILAKWALFSPTTYRYILCWDNLLLIRCFVQGWNFLGCFWFLSAFSCTTNCINQLNCMHLPQFFHSIWHLFWGWKFSALPGKQITSDSCCSGRPTTRWPTCIPTRRPTPSATARSLSMASLALSSAIPWPTQMPWFSGRVNSVTLPTPPSASLTSSYRAASQSGWGSLVLWCCFPTEWREWALNTVLLGRSLNALIFKVASWDKMK